MLAEQFVLNVGVLWEVFINELLLSYLIASPNRFSKNLSAKLFQSIDTRFGSTVSQLVRFSVPKELSIAKASALADPKNFNITVNSSDDLTTRANDLLEAKYARLFTLQPEDAQLLNFIVAMRNYLAHRSISAKTKLKKITSLLSGVNISLRGPVSNIGTYLKKRDANNNTRSVLIAKRLIHTYVGRRSVHPFEGPFPISLSWFF
jgi:hypothetical protein